MCAGKTRDGRTARQIAPKSRCARLTQAVGPKTPVHSSPRFFVRVVAKPFTIYNTMHNDFLNHDHYTELANFLLQLTFSASCLYNIPS